MNRLAGLLEKPDISKIDDFPMSADTAVVATEGKKNRLAGLLETTEPIKKEIQSKNRLAGLIEPEVPIVSKPEIGPPLTGPAYARNYFEQVPMAETPLEVRGLPEKEGGIFRGHGATARWDPVGSWEKLKDVDVLDVITHLPGSALVGLNDIRKKIYKTAKYQLETGDYGPTTQYGMTPMGGYMPVRAPATKEGLQKIVNEYEQKESRGETTVAAIMSGIADLPAYMGEMYAGGIGEVKSVPQALLFAGKIMPIQFGRIESSLEDKFKKGDKGYMALAKAMGDVYIENLSETAGAGFPTVARKLPFGGKLVDALHDFARKAGISDSEFWKRMGTKVGYNGLLGEWGEERLATFLRGLVNVDDFGAGPDSNADQRILAGLAQDLQWQNQAVELGVLSAPGAAKQVGKIALGRKEPPPPAPTLTAEAARRMEGFYKPPVEQGRITPYEPEPVTAKPEEIPPISELFTRLEEARRKAEEKLGRKVTKARAGKAEGPLVAQLFTQMEDLLEQAQVERDFDKRNAILDRMEKIDNIISQLSRENLESKDITQLQKMAKRFGVEIPKGADKETIIGKLAGRADLSQIQKTPTGYQVRIPIAETKAGRGWETHEFDTFAEATFFLESREEEGGAPAVVTKPKPKKPAPAKEAPPIAEEAAPEETPQEELESIRSVNRELTRRAETAKSLDDFINKVSKGKLETVNTEVLTEFYNRIKKLNEQIAAEAKPATEKIAPVEELEKKKPVSMTDVELESEIERLTKAAREKKYKDRLKVTRRLQSLNREYSEREKEQISGMKRAERYKKRKQVEDEIRETAQYQMAVDKLEGLKGETGEYDRYYVPKGQSTVVDEILENKKGFPTALQKLFTHDPRKGKHIDEAARESETGELTDIDAFIDSVIEQSKLDPMEDAIEMLNRSDNWQDVALAARYGMLKEGNYSEKDISDAIEEIRLVAEAENLDNIDEADYDREIETVREAAAISEEELKAERAAIREEAEAPEVKGGFLEGLEEKAPAEPKLDMKGRFQKVLAGQYGKNGWIQQDGNWFYVPEKGEPSLVTDEPTIRNAEQAGKRFGEIHELTNEATFLKSHGVTLYKMGDIVEYEGKQHEVGHVNRREFAGTVRLQNPKTKETTHQYIEQYKLKLITPAEKVVEEAKPAAKKAVSESDRKRAKRLRIMADNLDKHIEDKRREMTQNPTPKRMREYYSRLHDADNMERTQKAMRAMADALEKGELPAVLEDVKSKADIARLVYKGTKPGGYYEVIPDDKYRDTSEAGKTLQSMIEKGETAEEKEVREEREKKEQITKAEEKFRFLKIPGFFPTPRAVVDDMVDRAYIEEGMTILEPSAGKGDIADVLKEQGHDVKVVEIRPGLQEVLRMKGHDVVGTDFLEYKGKYDRILMNPPFEKGQDIDHVRHAYELLNPGGKIVAIMSEGTFFNSQKKYVAFREWLADVGGTSEKLEPGAFKDIKAFRRTGINARIVEISKPEAAEKPTAEEISANVQSLIDVLSETGKIAKTNLMTYLEDEKDLSPARAGFIANAYREEGADKYIKVTGNGISEPIRLELVEKKAERKPTVEEADKEVLINEILKLSRNPMPQITEVFELKGTDGKWYRPQGFPIGVDYVGEKRSVGFAYVKNGVTYGTRADTKQELIDRFNKNENKKADDFRKELEKMPFKRVQEQAEFWRKESRRRKGLLPEKAVPEKQAKETQAAIDAWANREKNKAKGASWNISVISNTKKQFEDIANSLKIRPWIKVPDIGSNAKQSFMRNMIENNLLQVMWDRQGNSLWATLEEKPNPKLYTKEQIEKLGPPEATEDEREKLTYKIDYNQGTIKFNNKPSETIRSMLKINGFRWSPKNSLWYRSRRGNWDFTETLEKEVDKYNGVKKPDGKCWECGDPNGYFRNFGAATPVLCAKCAAKKNKEGVPPQTETFITDMEKNQLKELGYTVPQILNMTPEQARSNIRNRTPEIRKRIKEVAPNLTDAQVDGILALWSANAKVNNMTLPEWIDKNIADLRAGVKPGKKAAIQFMRDGRAIITAFENADVSSFIHETGHIFRRQLSLEQNQLVLKELGFDPTEVLPWQWNTEAEEKFARAFERYIYEGKAPSPEVRGIFNKLAEWLREIYQNIMAFHPLNINISPEIRNVFDNFIRKDTIEHYEPAREIGVEGRPAVPGPARRTGERGRREGREGTVGYIKQPEAREGVEQPAVPTGRSPVIQNKNELPTVDKEIVDDLLNKYGGPRESELYQADQGPALDEHQIFGISLALKAIGRGDSFILADGTGFGKTRQCIVVAHENQQRTKKPSLIVTQNKEIIKTIFERQAKILGIDLSKIEVGTYHGLNSGKIGNKRYGVVIFDESHNLKNFESGRSMASRKINTDTKLFVTATPMDKHTSAAYFLSEISGVSMEDMMNRLGFHIETRTDPYTGKTTQYTVTNENVSWSDVIDNIIDMRDQAIRKGTYLRREMPFKGVVRPFEIAMPNDFRVRQDDIYGYWEYRIKRARSRDKKRNLGMMRSGELSRFTESQKVRPVLQAVLNDLKNGEKVIVVAEGIKPTEIKALHEVVPGFIGSFTRDLKNRNIKYAAIYGGGNKAKQIDAFQNDEVQIAVMTPQSGGTGVDLDDTIGNNPRKMYIVSMSWAGDQFEQNIGRVSRRNTKSDSEVRIVQGRSISDDKRMATAGRKLRTLTAIQRGEDLDRSGGIEVIDENGDRQILYQDEPKPWDFTREELTKWEIFTGEVQGAYEGEIPPLGSWRLDKTLGDMAQLRMVPMDEITFGESITDPVIAADVEKYAKWWKEGKRPYPPYIVENVADKNKVILRSLNRRRILGAKKAGETEIMAWVSESTPEGRAKFTHENVVKQAVEEGKPVRHDVLMDYKDKDWAKKALAKMRDVDLLGREELRGGAAGEQMEMFDKENFLTLEERKRINAKRDIKGQGTLFQEETPIWYSKLEYAVVNKMPNKMKSEDFRNWTKKQGGIKDEEMLWSGVDELLSKKDTVTKQEILDTIRENNVQIEEVVKGGKGIRRERTEHEISQELTQIENRIYDFTNETRKLLEKKGIYEEYRSTWMNSHSYSIPWNIRRQSIAKLESALPDRDFDEYIDLWDQSLALRHELDVVRSETEFAPERTKFQQYTLPGGTNYHEVLLRLPSSEVAVTDAVINRVREDLARKNELNDEVENAIDKWANNQSRENAEKLEELAGINLAHYYGDERVKIEAADYVSPHWAETNVLAHFRITDRRDKAGNKILFIEEIQSDWHQRGREVGYTKGVPKTKIVESEYSWKVIDEEGNLWGEVGKGTVKDKEAAEEYLKRYLKEKEIAMRSGSVPQAPFKTTWHELAFKRILRMAAEEGYDKIAWTTGEQQAERYDLSQQVDGLVWDEEDGTIYVRRKGANAYNAAPIAEGVTRDKLADYVGKEAAPKLAEAPVVKSVVGVNFMEGDVEGTHELTGVDLKIGGEGMKGFYDKMLPAYVKKYTKKFGVKKVGETEIEVPKPRTPSTKQYVPAETVHSIPVTDNMKQSVLEGQPLYQSEELSEQDKENIRRTFNMLIRWGGKKLRLKEYEKVQVEKKRERKRRVAIVARKQERVVTNEEKTLLGSIKYMGGGQLTEYAGRFIAVRPKLSADVIDSCFKSIRTSGMRVLNKFNTADAFRKFIDGHYLTLGEVNLIYKHFGPQWGRIALRHVPTGDRVWLDLMEAMNIPRTMLASFDMSGILRQARPLGQAYPKEYARMMKGYWKAFWSHNAAMKLEASTIADPFYEEAKTDGILELVEWGETVAQMIERAERFGGAGIIERAAEVPVAGIPLKPIAAGVRASERSFVTALNWMRMAVYSKIRAEQERSGKVISIAERKALANRINDLTGRSHIKRTAAAKSLAPFMQALFSPRFTISRFKPIVTLPKDAINSMRDGKFRSELSLGLTALTSLMLTNFLIMFILKFFDDEDKIKIETDLQSSDGGKIRVGISRFDLWSGYLQPAQLLVRLTTGQRKTQAGNYIDVSRGELLETFGRSKANPIVGLVIDAYTGRTFYGGRFGGPPKGRPGEIMTKYDVPEWLQGVGKEVWNRIIPLAIQDTADALVDDGIPMAITAGTFSFLGGGAQTYPMWSSTQLRIEQNKQAQRKYKKPWDELNERQQENIMRMPLLKKLKLRRQQEKKYEGPPRIDWMIEEQDKISRQIYKKLPENVQSKMDELGLKISAPNRYLGDWYLNDKRYDFYVKETTKNMINIFKKGVPKNEKMFSKRMNLAKEKARIQLRKMVRAGKI